MGRILFLILAFAPAVYAHARGFELTPDFHYSTSETAINAYDDTGLLVHSLAWGNSDLRGLAIGPDNNLYVVRSTFPMSMRTRVDVLNAQGQLIMYYGSNAGIWGNLSYGTIAHGSNGNTFYVGTSDGVYAFDNWSRSGRRLTTTNTFGIDVLPSGELLTASNTEIARRTPNGDLIEAFTLISDPNGLTGLTDPRLEDIRGVAYSAATDRTYVTMVGYTNFSFRLLAFEGTTNRLVAQTYFWYGGDIHIDDAGHLLVGSRTQAPAWFTPDLEMIGQLDGPPARFVTGFRELPADPDDRARD